MKSTRCFLCVLFLLCIAVHAMTSEEKKRILVGSPIRQKPAILEQFLNSLLRLERDGYTLDYYFVDDNDLEASKKLLANFKGCDGEHVLVQLPSSLQENRASYECTETTHLWKDELVWKVAAFKDNMIHRAREQGYEYLFLIDSDIVLHPKTVSKLMRDDKEIVSNIFWTKWTPGARELPQVWMTDHYTLYRTMPGETLTDDQKRQKEAEFLALLRVPGVYEVGGLGACTLISKKALLSNVSFRQITNVTLWGEDRHFCIRAVAMGIPLFVDTQYPAYHIYRDSDLSGVDTFIRSCNQE